MTLVAALSFNGCPTLIGDVVASYNGQRSDDHVGKIYRIASNAAVGWSGVRGPAQRAIGELTTAFMGRTISGDDLEAVLQKLGGDDPLVLAGWLVASGARTFKWDAAAPRSLDFSTAEVVIGSGTSWLGKMLATRSLTTRSAAASGHNAGAQSAITLVSAAFFAELFAVDPWDPTWGTAYDVLVWKGSEFIWLPEITYLAWNVKVRPDFSVERVEHGPIVAYKRVGDECAILAAKSAEHGFWRWRKAISEPVHRKIDTGPYLNRPARPASQFYANHLHIYAGDDRLVVMNMASVTNKPGQPRPREAAMWSEGDGDDVTFHMDNDALGLLVQSAIFSSLPK